VIAFFKKGTDEREGSGGGEKKKKKDRKDTPPPQTKKNPHSFLAEIVSRSVAAEKK